MYISAALGVRDRWRSGRNAPASSLSLHIASLSLTHRRVAFMRPISQAAGVFPGLSGR